PPHTVAVMMAPAMARWICSPPDVVISRNWTSGRSPLMSRSNSPRSSMVGSVLVVASVLGERFLDLVFAVVGGVSPFDGVPDVLECFASDADLGFAPLDHGDEPFGFEGRVCGVWQAGEPLGHGFEDQAPFDEFFQVTGPDVQVFVRSAAHCSSFPSIAVCCRSSRSLTASQMSAAISGVSTMPMRRPLPSPVWA